MWLGSAFAQLSFSKLDTTVCGCEEAAWAPLKIILGFNGLSFHWQFQAQVCAYLPFFSKARTKMIRERKGLVHVMSKMIGDEDC